MAQPFCSACKGYTISSSAPIERRSLLTVQAPSGRSGFTGALVEPMRDKGLHNCVTKGYTTVYGPVSHRLVGSVLK